MKEPTRPEIEEIARKYFGTDEERAYVHKRLRAWGNKALPLLHELVLQRDNSGGAMVCIAGIETPEAFDLIVALAREGKIGVRETALGLLMSRALDERWKDALDRNPRFKDMVFALATHESWFCRSQVATIMGVMGWKGGIALLERMLEDENLSLRQSAAEALERLTGKKPPIRLPELMFPRVALVENAIESIGQLPDCGWMTAGTSFARWFDGTPALAQNREGRIAFFNAALQMTGSLKCELYSHNFLSLPLDGTGHQLVALVSNRREPVPRYVVSLTAEGDRLWQLRQDKGWIQGLAPLYGDAGEISGVVIGRSGSAVVVLDLKGELRWEVEATGVQSVSTHPAFPNTFGACRGLIEVFRAGERVAASQRREKRLTAHDIVIFPDKDANLSVVITATGKDSTPVIARLDASMNEVWRANLPNRASTLALIENCEFGNGQVVVTATKSGDLLLFDTDGCLLHQSRLPGEAEADFFVFGIESGELGEMKKVFFVSALKSVNVYRIMA